MRKSHASLSLRVLAALLALVMWAGPSAALGEGFLDWLLSQGKQYLYGWEMGSTPYVEVDGIRLEPVYITSDYSEIREVFGDEIPYERCMWYIRLEVVNGPFDAAAVEAAAGKLKMYLYDGGGYEIGAYATRVDADDPSVAHRLYRFEGGSGITGVALRYQEINYSLENLRDVPTPAPTAVPTPAPIRLTEEQKQAFHDHLMSVYGASNDINAVFHLKGSKVFIALFNEDDEVIATSLDARGGDYYGLPAELLAASEEEADEVIYIYRFVRWIGTYTDGSGAARGIAMGSVVRGDVYKTHELVTHEPPSAKTGGGDRIGSYDPFEGLEAAVKRILKVEYPELAEEE